MKFFRFFLLSFLIFLLPVFISLIAVVFLSDITEKFTKREKEISSCEYEELTKAIKHGCSTEELNSLSTFYNDNKISQKEYDEFMLNYNKRIFKNTMQSMLKNIEK